MKECSGFGSLAENFLLFEHRLSLRVPIENRDDESGLRSSRTFSVRGFLAMTSFLRFLAKNYNARYTESPNIRVMSRPRFLTEIPNTLYKLSFNSRV